MQLSQSLSQSGPSIAGSTFGKRVVAVVALVNSVEVWEVEVWEVEGRSVVDDAGVKNGVERV